MGLASSKRSPEKMSKIKNFFQSKKYAVVGASTDRSKFGNIVLRKYVEKGLEVVPVHPKLEEIEGLQVMQLSDLESPEEWGISIVTPPAVSLEVLKSARELGFKRFWLQPGADSKEIIETFKGAEDIEIIAGGPCVLVSLDRGEHRSE